MVCWSFNVEKAPWWGGFYERVVGSVKRCLKKVVGNAQLTFDELLTAIVEVEATLNARPLTYVATDDVQELLTLQPRIVFTVCSASPLLLG